ncbi:MAG TPA: hypothetical protein VMD76_06030 [Candidatus Sulfotelmatobacter sp.]|nr:hypothetical protein [Candidatus Sulfotelmatobacter sp.]
MKIAGLGLVFSLCLMSGCGTTPSSVTTSTEAAVRSYNGTASVGDFLTISIDSSALTITYKNYSNGESGTVPYTVNANGTYAIADPKGNLQAGYEVPGFVMMIETAKSGANEDTPALVTAIESVPASINTFAGEGFNYVQFRTANGGTEIGTITIDGEGNITHDGYSPFQVFSGDAFSGGSIAATGVQEDASGDFFTIADSGGSNDYAFGTANGFFVVDTGSGTILSLPKAAAKSFDARVAGSYTAIYYEKADAQVGPGNTETGTATEGVGSITVSAGGVVTISDSGGNTLATGTLAAVADTSYLYDGNSSELLDPLYGMFTFRTATVNSQQDVFVSFEGNAMIFSSFETALPIAGYAPYTYFYGVGLK